MRIKKKLNTSLVDQISGTPSIELLDHCPDLLHLFPSSPCTNRGCTYAIRQKGYMNCTFVAAEAGEHTLDQIGKMMELTREGVRLIEKRGLRKIRLALDQLEQENAAVREPDISPGTDNLDTKGHVSERQNQGDSLRAINGRKLAQRGRRTT